MLWQPFDRHLHQYRLSSSDFVILWQSFNQYHHHSTVTPRRYQLHPTWLPCAPKSMHDLSEWHVSCQCITWWQFGRLLVLVYRQLPYGKLPTLQGTVVKLYLFIWLRTWAFNANWGKGQSQTTTKYNAHVRHSMGGGWIGWVMEAYMIEYGWVRSNIGTKQLIENSRSPRAFMDYLFPLKTLAPDDSMLAEGLQHESFG